MRFLEIRDGINSCHGERFHKDVTNGAAKLTRKQSESMVKEMSDRLWEYITMDEATFRLASKLLISNEYTSYSANGIDANEDIPTTTTRKERDYISPENKCNTPKCEALVSGEYSFTVAQLRQVQFTRSVEALCVFSAEKERYIF